MASLRTFAPFLPSQAFGPSRKLRLSQNFPFWILCLSFTVYWFPGILSLSHSIPEICLFRLEHRDMSPPTLKQQVHSPTLTHMHTHMGTHTHTSTHIHTDTHTHIKDLVENLLFEEGTFLWSKNIQTW